MLSDTEVEEIRQGMSAGVRGPLILTWLERLLRDRDERIRRDREIAARLLAVPRQQEARGGPSWKRPR